MILENATLFSIFLLGKGIHEKTPCDVTACRREYLRTAPGSEERLDRLGSPWSVNAFGVLPAVRADSRLEHGEVDVPSSVIVVPFILPELGGNGVKFRSEEAPGCWILCWDLFQGGFLCEEIRCRYPHFPHAL
ncbi:hypothetical protein AVEN_208791-1 [Araneus ventricosus]|uniref:Uncharacterized protein n=1 Tax=Araneus ventricosus TaxID=182803 RepID=A0A4Y2LIS1_ARAVE|nr:hypothetical protein AVEN_208791-1 [Araneus ventricosus]